MIKKACLFLLLSVTTQLLSQDMNTLKKYALRDAQAACDATLKEDYKKLLSYTHSNILDAAGGIDVMVDYLKTTFEKMKSNGFKYEVAQTKSVSDVVKEQGEYRCYVENYNVMKMNNKRITSTSYMLGFYNEEKQKWTFVEAKEMKASGTIITYFPNFKTSLNIPENTMKTSDIKE